ncbi:MAG: polysaccharide deacetylase family protein [candidate division WOR-3 bacterium]|nr:MAG: polysaccharide deacetylase family protein [candidate division WOR-3 bacterium]
MIRSMLVAMSAFSVTTLMVVQQLPGTPAADSLQVNDSVLLTSPYRTEDRRDSLPAVDPLDPMGIDAADLSDRTVVFTIDDAYHSIFADAYPLFKQYRMPFTLGVITDYVRSGEPTHANSGGFMKRSEIQELIDSLHIEVASHSTSHPFLTRLDSATAWKEIQGSKVILESLFGKEVMTFVYPYGDVDARIRRMVERAGYRIGRAVRSGTPNFWVDPYRIPMFELRMETRLADVAKHIRGRKTTVLLVHQVVREPSVFTEWSIADFGELLAWLDRGNASVVTLSALFREWWVEKLVRFTEEVAAAYPDGRKHLLFQEVDVDATEAAHPR